MGGLIRGYKKHLTVPHPGWQRTDPLDRGLVGEWRFDPATGLMLPDYSGRGHHGTVVGAEWVSTQYGPALDFGDNDYVDLPSSDYVSTARPFTLEAFVHLDIFTQPFPHLITFDGELGWFLNTHGTYRPMAWGRGGGGEWANCRIPDLDYDFNDLVGAWRHLALVYNGQGGTVLANYTPYIDAISYNVGAGGGLVNYNTTRISQGQGALNYSFDGPFAYVRIYDRALNAGEVSGRREMCLKRGQAMTHVWMIPQGAVTAIPRIPRIPAAYNTLAVY